MKQSSLKCLTIILLCWHVIAMANISMDINPSPVQLGEAFRLTFTLDDPQANGVPDLTPLQNDFNIVGTERSTAYSIINGQTHSRHQWTVLLTAKKAGVLLIPSIQFGHQQSTANSIEVTGDQVAPTPEDLQKNTPQDEVMLKTEVSTKDPFVNQQLIYTVKLYNSQRLLDAEYVPPRVEDALLIPLGEGRRSQTILGGRGYTVEEQQYAVFPQKSGDLTIIAPSFKALVFETTPRRINVHAKETSLVVKPRPADFTGKYWLPATQAALTETYDQSNTMMNQGSTLVRTITLQVAGIPAQLLPTLTLPNSSQFNTYSQKPDLHNTARQNELIGRADIKVTYLFNKPGQVTIPAIQVPWFNTSTGKEEIVSLPERTLEIAPSSGSVPQQPTITPLSATKPAPALPLESLPIEAVKKSDGLAWWLAGGFGLAWMITLLLWWWIKKHPTAGPSKRLILKNMHEACVQNNPEQAQAAVMQWAAWQWPEAKLLNLQHVEKWVRDPVLKKQLSLLSQVLYSQGKNRRWQGDALWRSVRAYTHKKSAGKSKNSELPPINPG